MPSFVEIVTGQGNPIGMNADYFTIDDNKLSITAEIGKTVPRGVLTEGGALVAAARIFQENPNITTGPKNSVTAHCASPEELATITKALTLAGFTLEQ